MSSRRQMALLIVAWLLSRFRLSPHACAAAFVVACFAAPAFGAQALRFDSALFGCPCDVNCFCQTHFDHLNWVGGTGHYLVTTTDNHRSQAIANGNDLAAYWNDLNTGWTFTSATQQADDISTWVLANFSPAPAWITLNEISAGTWPTNQTYRTWVHDVVHRLKNTYGYNVILFAPFANPGANDADWQAVSADCYIGVECYLSGEEVQAQNFSVSWCQAQYQSSKTSYMNRGVPASKIFLAEHFAQTVAGTGWGRAGLSYADWDKCIIVRSTAIRNVGFAGFLSYAWRNNGMDTSTEDMVHFEDTYAAQGLPAANGLPASYTWVGGNGAYGTASNWSPARSAPAVSDVLVFDGSQSGQSAPIITISGDDTISQLRFTNNVSATFNPTASSTITCQSTGAVGSGDEALQVEAGTNLNLAGTTANSPMIIALASTSFGVVDGNVWFDNGNDATIYDRIASLQSGGLLFRVPSKCYVAGAIAPAGGCFGQSGGPAATTSVNGGVVFNAGAEYHHQMKPDGTRSAAAYPFPHQLTSPNSMVTWDSGSNFIFWANNSAGFTGRSFADLTFRSNAAVSVSAPTSVENLNIENNGTGTQFTVSFQAATAAAIAGNLTVDADSGGFRLAASGARNLSVGGDISIGAIGKIANTTANDTLVLNGSALQTVNFAGSTIQKLQVNNASGVLITGDLVVSSLLDLASGDLSTNGNTLTAPDLTGLTRTNGFVSGVLTRHINLTASGTRSFPVGTSSYAGVDLVINNAGTGSGTLAVSTTDGDPPGVTAPANVLDRYWTLTDSALDLSGTSAQLKFHYLTADVTGGVNESTMIVARKPSGGSWLQYTPSSRDTANNVITVDNVPDFSIWTLAAPEAVPISLSSFSVE